MPVYPVNFSNGEICIDLVRIETNGLIQIEGWHRSDVLEGATVPGCLVNNQSLPVFQTFRTYRPDVAAALNEVTKPMWLWHKFRRKDRFDGTIALNKINDYPGVVFQYQLIESLPAGERELKITYKDAVIFEIIADFSVSVPHYAHLFNTSVVMHRQDIYAFGPPARFVLPEVVSLARTLPGPVLDFGCGSGLLVQMLRNDGVEAFGIELERDPIIQTIPPDVKDFITLYPGQFPLPFKDQQFRSVIAVEVIEHVPDYTNALTEISRVTAENFIVTVPDMSSIPALHHNNVVPWHLLESTHVNFFTQNSLEQILSRYFSSIKFVRIAPTLTNDTKWFSSLVGVCKK